MFFPFKTFAMITLTAVMIASAAPVASGPQQRDKDKKEESSGGSTFMSQATYNRLSRAHKAIEEGRYADALEELRDLADDVKSRPYEYAVTMQSMGYVFISQEKWETAADYMERALAQKALPAEAEKQVVYTLAQIHATLANYQKTITLMTDWFKTAEDPPADAYVIVANAYAAQDKYREAYPYVKQAIEKSEKPREDWYKLALGIQFELKKFSEAAGTLETLIANWPDKDQYWKQLSGVYIELGQDAKALATMALAYERGLVTKSEDILNLARLYLLNDVPLKAGGVLQKALNEGSVERVRKNYELLSQSWVQAREYEKGIAALGQAAELAEGGELYVRQAQLHMALANWDGAMRAARNALEKGGLESKKSGQAWLLLGTAAAEKKDFDAAISAFNKARGYPETRRTATQWLAFVQTEKQVSVLN